MTQSIILLYIIIKLSQIFHEYCLSRTGKTIPNKV